MAPSALADDAWEVICSPDAAGVAVRTKRDAAAPQLEERLACGALVKGVFYDEGTASLRYRLISGTGPSSGWVSTWTDGKQMLLKAGEEPATKQPRARKPVKTVEEVCPKSSLFEANRRFPIRRAPGAPPSNVYSLAVKAAAAGQAAPNVSYGVRKFVPSPALSQDCLLAADSDGEEMSLCPQCHLPVGELGYLDKAQGIPVHGECKAQLLLGEAKEDEKARARHEGGLKQKERAKYNIGWKADLIPRNQQAAAMLGCTDIEGMCCLVLDEGSNTVRVAPTADPAAAVNLEYLSYAMLVRLNEGREPLFSLDVKDSPDSKTNEPQDLWQTKRFEPAWLAGTSVGDVMFQADYHLKELSMGECPQPVVGMMSCFDLSNGEWHENDWRAREWFVVNKAEIRRSEEDVLIPVVKMGVEAREQLQGPHGVEDAVLSRKEHPLVRYAEDFTENFDLIAERRSSIYHLRELAKASVLAKHLLDTQVNLEQAWLDLAPEPKNMVRLEIPQLWNQRVSSQVQLQDGKILDAEKGMGMGTRGVYGGVQFGLDKFDLGATTMQPGAGEAPYSLLFSGADRGSIMARGVVTPPSLMEPRGVDLNLGGFDLSKASREESVRAFKELATGNAFWPNVDGSAGSLFKDEHKNLFRDVFNSSLSDRRDDGDLFVPPDVREAHLQALQCLVAKETRVREQRTAHFFGSNFEAARPGRLFPSSWTSSFEISRQDGAACALESAQADEEAMRRVIAAAAPVFDKIAEDGARFRIYRYEGLEVRTVQEQDGCETPGAAFAVSACPQGPSTGAAADSERVVKAIEYVEQDGEECRYYTVFSTEAGSMIGAERLADGKVALAEDAQGLAVRSSIAKVLRSTECSATLTVQDIKELANAQEAAGASRSERKRFARAAFERARA